MGGSYVRAAGVSRLYVSGEESITALDDVSLEVSSGSVVAVTGPSGSGKSTLLHLIGAMDRADSGSIQVGETDVSGLTRKQQADYRRTVGFVFQRFHLLPALSVVDNVAVPLLPYRTAFDKRARALELLAAVGLEDRARSLPSRLSGGQQQRVAIARALINAPTLLLADEPTGNLDSDTGTQIIDLLLELRDSRGMTVLLATHDPQVAARCDRVVGLEDGRLTNDSLYAARGS
ncbi:MAG: ABC transporter ATP-binding protein [Actinobacteria bacterium]|nr:ABC transporter ATP-binding protein [Actinomycetota bacterium]